MSLQQNSQLDEQDSISYNDVRKWLHEPENQSFTDNFIINWVKQHPELKKDILLRLQSEGKLHLLFPQQHKAPTKKGRASHLPRVSHKAHSVESANKKEAKTKRTEGSDKSAAKGLSASLVSQHSNKAERLESTPSSTAESGVELLKSNRGTVSVVNIKAEVVQETECEGKNTEIAIKPVIETSEQKQLKRRTKQLEGLLEFVVVILNSLTDPQQALTKILSHTKHLIVCKKCRFLLVEDKRANPNQASGTSPKFIRVFEMASDKSDVDAEFKNVDIMKLSGINVATDVVKKGHLLVSNDHEMLCCPLFGVEGQIIGVMQLFGDSLKSLDLDFVKRLALISGLAIDNSVSFSMLRNATEKLLYVSTKLENALKTAIQSSPAENISTPLTCIQELASASMKQEATTVTKKLCESTPEKVEAQLGTVTMEDTEIEDGPEQDTSESEVTQGCLGDVTSEEDHESQKKRKPKGLQVFKSPLKALKKLNVLWA